MGKNEPGRRRKNPASAAESPRRGFQEAREEGGRAVEQVSEAGGRRFRGQAAGGPESPRAGRERR